MPLKTSQKSDAIFLWRADAVSFNLLSIESRTARKSQYLAKPAVDPFDMFPKFRASWNGPVKISSETNTPKPGSNKHKSR
jgi:hypothetical protein